MAHIALMPFPAHGHVNPTLPVASALVRRGHRVTFPTTAEFTDTVVDTGATPLVYRSLLAGKEQPESFTADYIAHEPLRCINEGMLVTGQLKVAFAQDVPDLFVYDVSTFPTGRALASIFDRPGLQLFPVFASNERFSFGQAQSAELAEPVSPDHPALIEFFERTEAFLAEHGLSDTDVWEFLRPCDDHNLAFLPKQFQLHADDFDDRHAFVGPCLRPAPQPDGWLDEADDRPLVLISLGTTFNRNAEFFRRCAAAFVGLSWRVVITLGSGSVDPAELSDLTHVEVYQWAPHTVLLSRASVFVCHAGMGSMMEALSFGVPLVLVPPDVTEHRINARR
ncbi:MAG: hypothetical protein JO100_15820, partial [Pseudonocardia sp.]|nr:hypothetical protein [Pseudonocardia sp.]